MDPVSLSVAGSASPSAFPSAPAVIQQHSSTLTLLGWVMLSALKAVPKILYFVIVFITITAPTWMYTLLSVSLTVTVNFSTLAFITLAVISTASYILRYRYHTYGRAPPELGRKEPGIEVPDPVPDSKPGLSSYLDEFLSAIKVFGYLERPVFHELTRTMHTRKLIAGETFLLEEEKGFCLVVEGTVQIFTKSPKNDDDSDDESGNDDGQSREGQHRYRLLTEIKNGSPMSSLFSILSLFSEDITTKGNAELTGLAVTGSFQSNSLDGSRIGDGSAPRGLAPRRFTSEQMKARSQPQSRLASPDIPAGHISHIPPLSLDEQVDTTFSSPKTPDKQFEPKMKQKAVSAHPHIVARAAEDSTVAIIPAAAFKRLTKMYPRSTAHIVQVILNRFYRVTLATAHGYLGLTHQILQTERQMNKLVISEIPNILLDHHLESLKAKFSQEKDRLGDEDISKGIALHNPRFSRHRSSSNSIKKELAAGARITAAKAKMNGNGTRSSSPEDDRSGISAGDLFKGKGKDAQSLQTPWPKESTLIEDDYSHPRPMRLQRQESLEDGFFFREAILQCMCSAMGLSNLNPLPRLESREHSPRLISYDSKRKKAVFNTVFGLMDPYEGPGEGDSESSFSILQSSFNSGQAPNIYDEIIDDVEIVYFQKDSVLVDQQERVPGLYYVIDGFLEIGITMESDLEESSFLKTSTHPDLTTSMEEGQNEQTGQGAKEPRVRQSLFLVKPGSLAGYLPAVSGFRSFVDIKAKSDVIVGFLPRAALEKLVEKYPIILLTLAKRLTSLLDHLILHIDFALDYMQVNAGQIIYEQNQSSDAIYIILNGRLRAIQMKPDKSISVLGEYGQGDSVGELEVLTEAGRPGSLHAIRDSELARLPMTLFNSLAQEHPAIALKMSKVLAKRMRTLMYTPSIDTAKERAAIGGVKNSSSTVNLRTVGIIPVREGVPLTEFATRLASALSQVGASVTTINQTQILKHLGKHAFSKMGKLKLSQYLADLEEKFGIILYVADTSVQSPWTSTCILQSDCILVVGVAHDFPGIGEYERALLTAKTTARKELVLLHPERYCPAGLTRKWLSKRVWINGGHHHVQIVGVSAQSQQGQVNTRRLGAAIKQRVRVIQSELQKYTGRKTHQKPLYSPVAPFKSDFHRLARRLCGKSIGLVLGGGGARGCAHVGIIRAMEEAGIPIDIVGGTSIGAFVGALYAWDASIVPMYGRIKRFAGRMGSMWRFALDLTYPAASYTTGLEFNRGTWLTFGNYLIEDFWLPFYCNTTNISKSCAEYHNSGYVWRYVRASMSLAGLLPPLCEDGSMLLDGGYIDNLTVAHMKSLGVDVIFAVDVGSLDDNTPQMYGDSLSGFWTLWNRFNPFSSSPNPPSLGDIQSRLAYVSSVEALERAKSIHGCHYMRPPIDPFGTLAFGEFDEIYRVGYEYGKKFMAELREKNILPVMEEAEEEKGNLRRTRMIRRASI